MMPALSATSRIMKIGLSSDTVNLTDMFDIAYWKIRARLLRVPGLPKSRSGASGCRNGMSRWTRPRWPRRTSPCSK